MNTLRLPDTSPQLSAVSYGRAPYVSMEPFVEAQAELLPQLYEQEERKRYQEEQLRLAQQQRRDARRDANIAMGIKGAELGINAATNLTLQRYGVKVWEALKPKPPVIQAPITSMPTTLSPGYAGGVTSLSVPSATPVTVPQVPYDLTMPQASLNLTDIPESTSLLTTESANLAGNQAPSLLSRATEFKGIMPRFGGKGLAAGAGNLALQAVPSAVNYGLERAIIGKKATGSEQAVADISTSLSSFMLGGPIGLGLNLGKIGFREFSKKNCIITTCIYGADSHEVDVCRKYRDKFLDRETLVGYYHTAEQIIPLLESYPELKEFVRVNLIDPLVRVGEFKLKMTDKHPSLIDFAITKNFLSYCKDKGSVLKTFTRSTGEKI